MKKLIVSLLCIGLLSNLVSAVSMVRIWRCRPSNPSTDCTQKERDIVEEWFRSAKLDELKALIAELAAIGTRVSMSQLQREQATLTTKPLDERLRQQSEQFRETQKAIEDMQRQRQGVVREITK